MLSHVLKLIWNKKRANLLLFFEIFFCFLVVFVVATFCISNFRAYFSPFGYETEGIWVVRQSAIEQMDSTQMIEAQELFKREILALDGVQSAAYAGYAIPFTGSMWSTGGDDMGFDFWSTMIGGDEDYADVLGLEMRSGRYFNQADHNSKYQPVIVNQFMVDEYFDGVSRLDSIILFDDKECLVVGVAENIRYRDGFEGELPTTIILTEPGTDHVQSLMIRVDEGSGPELEQAIGQVVFNVLKTEDYNVVSMHESRLRIARRTWIPIVILLVIGTFLIVNIALGLFGVLFYTISKRRGEIGVRRAMGAFRSEIVRQFTLEIYLVALAAMLLGALLAIQVPALGLIDSSDLAYDNFYYAILFAFLLISLVVLACAYWPSRQGANLHPAVALHEE